jgi:SAM-dependent methyltransferase
MEFTGERVIPGKVEPDLFNEHLCRYHFAGPLVAGKKVLDLGCGAGYGTFELARKAQWAAGLDISPEAIEYARRHYALPNLNYLVGDCCQTGLVNASFDAIICFELIEHLAEQPSLMEEICRLLKPSGFVLISTPNRLFYTEELNQHNAFHTHEFDFDEFHSFLGRYFEQVDFYYQNHVDSIFIGDPLQASQPAAILGEPLADTPATAN